MHKIIKKQNDWTAVSKPSPVKLRRSSTPSARGYHWFFYPHRFVPQVLVEEVAGTFAKVIKLGKVRRLGHVRDQYWYNLQSPLHTAPWPPFIQKEYHLMHRNVVKRRSGLLTFLNSIPDFFRYINPSRSNISSRWYMRWSAPFAVPLEFPLLQKNANWRA